jgi:hypothetical protein
MKNIIRTFVGIEMSLLSCLAFSLATQNCVAFGVSGAVGTEKIITSENSSLNKNRLFQEKLTTYMNPA